MKGDFTRFTFDPTKRYTNVLKQQGRVDLDADWNEQSAIDTYLDRISRMDLSGVESGAPSLKPGFEVTVPAGGGDLNISEGRFYAKGIICELFQPTTYLTQPFLPSPPPLTPVPAGGRTDSVYLDVWRRHITAIEDPSIKEIALGGPDTTTRIQTIFQIRINGGVGAVDCPGAPLPAPSGALLSSSLVPVPPEDDLCLIGATGGYRGLENRLYRVEIHTPGALGTATFKWSRDNGSVVFPISEFVAGQPTKIRVTRLGRDQILTLHEGDWVEVLDDNIELAGSPGAMAQVQNIDAANRELTLSVAVSGTMSAHPKVRRWDQKSAPIATSATPIALEDGIQVSFGGSNFKTGDFWMFAARVTDGSIETLTNQLAQGIDHVYAQLAIVTWTGATNATIHDCRKIFPLPGGDCCCCTLTVGDGVTSKGDFNSIQEAVDNLPATDEFGEVCILAGRYVLAAPVVVTRNNILIRGCGLRSSIEGPTGGPALVITKSQNVHLEALFVVSSRTAPAIQVVGVRSITISRCQLRTPSGFSLLVGAVDCRISENVFGGGIEILNGSRDVLIVHNRIESGVSPGIGLGGGQGTDDSFMKMAYIPATGIRSVDIRDNRIVSNADSGICTLYRGDNRALGVDGISIADNLISENVRRQERSVAVGGIVLQLTSNIRIFRNEITNNGGKKGGACGIFLFECSNIDIEDNSILDNGNTQDVIHADCINFQEMSVGTGEDPRVEGDVTFTLMDDAGAVLPPSRIVSTSLGGGAVFTGLLGAPNVSIALPPADGVEITLLGPLKFPIQLAALDAAGTQVSSITVTGTATAQPVPLAGPDITKVTLTTTSPEYLILEFCRILVPVASDPQGGILAHIITTDHSDGAAAAFPAGYPAMRVHNNVVNTPAGHSLLINAIGQVSVEGNSLTSNGALKQPDMDFVTPFGVAIYDFGITYAPQDTFFLLLLLLVMLRQGSTGFGLSDTLFDGRVLFQGNQVAFRNLSGTIEPGSLAFGIVGLDACQIANNQFRAECGGRLLGVDLLAVADTVCATGNAFSEIPNSALLSAYALARNVIVSLNQSMHCLSVSGIDQEFNQANQITISTLCPDVLRFVEAFRG